MGCDHSIITGSKCIMIVTLLPTIVSLIRCGHCLTCDRLWLRSSSRVPGACWVILNSIPLSRPVFGDIIYDVTQYQVFKHAPNHAIRWQKNSSRVIALYSLLPAGIITEVFSATSLQWSGRTEQVQNPSKLRFISICFVWHWPINIKSTFLSNCN